MIFSYPPDVTSHSTHFPPHTIHTRRLLWRFTNPLLRVSRDRRSRTHNKLRRACWLAGCACMTHSRSVDSEALTKWAFYSENRGAQPGRETVRMMSLWLGASSVGHNPAAALRRETRRDETVYPCMVWALRALPKKGTVVLARSST